VIVHELRGTGSSDRTRLLGDLARADAERTPLVLDLTPLDVGNASKRRLNGSWICLLGNLLLGRYSELALRVKLPEEHSIQLQLLRSAFYFSLVQRPGRTELPQVSPRSKRLLDANRGDWSPRSGPVLIPEANGEKLEEHTYLYSNTHLVAEPGYFRRYEASAAFPWLGEVIPRSSNAQGDLLRDGFLSATCDTIGEVVDNISTHAFNLRNTAFSAGWLGPQIVRRSRSCLIVSLTTGGQRSYDRLHFLAFDNGFSIPRTLRWQHPDPLRFDKATDLMERVLQRRLTNREITDHNGAGLWFLFGLARFAGGELTLTSEDDQSDGRKSSRVSAVIPAAESTNSSRWKTEELDIPVRGTIVHLQLRIPRLVDSDPASMATRIEEFRRYRSSWPAMA
jgi:hypothetical protein